MLKMFPELVEELLAVSMLGEGGEGLLDEDIAGLEISCLLSEAGVVVVTLEHVWAERGSSL